MIVFVAQVIVVRSHKFRDSRHYNKLYGWTIHKTEFTVITAVYGLGVKASKKVPFHAPFLCTQTVTKWTSPGIDDTPDPQNEALWKRGRI